MHWKNREISEIQRQKLHTVCSSELTNWDNQIMYLCTFYAVNVGKPFGIIGFFMQHGMAPLLHKTSQRLVFIANFTVVVEKRHEKRNIYNQPFCIGSMVWRVMVCHFSSGLVSQFTELTGITFSVHTVFVFLCMCACVCLSVCMYPMQVFVYLIMQVTFVCNLAYILWPKKKTSPAKKIRNSTEFVCVCVWVVWHFVF